MAVELSQGYVSLSVATEGAQREVQRMFDGWMGLAANAGKKAGDSLGKGLGDATKVALADAQAAHERYAINVANSTKKAVAASEAQEAALRKVAIAEARLTELESSGKASKAQLLAAEDRLASARKSASNTALKQAAADKSVTDAQDALRASSVKLESAQKAVESSATSAGNSANTMADRIKAGIQRVKDNIPGSTLFKPIADSGETNGKRAGDALHNGISNGVERAKTSSMALASFMGNIGANIVSKLGDLAVSGVRAGVETAASMEQANISFTTMLGSADKANTFVAKLADFAAKTPFDFPGLQSSASTLLSAGVNADKIIPIMKTLGDVTSGMGTGAEGVQRATKALQQMNAAGKITGEDLNQLRDAGIPVYDLLAAATGKTKEQVSALAASGKLGKKELDAMMSALETGKGLEKFTANGGLMIAQSQSLNGLWSTFTDNLQMGLGKAINPLIPALKDGLGGAATWLGDVAMPGLAKGLQGVIDGAKTFVGWIESSGIQGTVMNIVDVVKLFVGSFTGQGADVSFDGSLFNQVIDLGASAGDTVDKLTDSFTRNLLPGVMALAGGVRDNLVPFVQHLVDLFIQYMLPVVVKIADFWSTQLLPVLGRVATFIGTQVIPVIATIARVVIDTVIPALAAIYTVILEKVMPPLMAFINYVMENVAPKVILVFNEIIIPLFKLLAAVVTWLVNNVVVPILGLLGDFLTNVLGPVFKWLWEKAISPAIDSIIGAIHWVRDDGVKTFTDFIDKVKETVGNGVETVGKIWDGIKAAFQGPMKFVQDIINGLIDAFNTVSKIFGGPNVAHISIVAAQANPGGVAPGFASGGVLPGYSPGVDNMHFYSPQWGSLDLSGGEAIMVPEFARAVGEQGISMLNRAARAGKQTLSGVLGGMHFANGGLVNFRGGTFTTEFARRLQLAEAMAQTVFSIAQGGFRPATSYSGTSHQGDAVDIGNPINNAVLIALRSLAIPAWDRTGMGNWMPHIHGVPLPGAGEAAGSAVWQAQDYLAGGDGLGGRDTGPRVGLLDSLSGIVLNLASGAASLINWPATFAAQIAKAANIEAPGLFGDVLRAVPGTIATTIGAGANKLLGLPGFASGTVSAPAGWGWVGEAGPELIRFRGGEQVLSTGDSGRLGGGVGGDNAASVAAQVASKMDGMQVQITGANMFADTIYAMLVLEASRKAGH